MDDFELRQEKSLIKVSNQIFHFFEDSGQLFPKGELALF